jgi:hypothetical protein
VNAPPPSDTPQAKDLTKKACDSKPKLVQDWPVVTHHLLEKRIPCMLLAAITSLTGWRKKTPPPLIEYLDQTITFPLHNSRLQILFLVERNRSSPA